MGSKGFPDGWNSLPHASALKDTELGELLNGIYSQYGSVSKRQGTQILGAVFPDGATHMVAGGTFYNIGGADYTIAISNIGKVYKFNFTTLAWNLLTATVPVWYTDSDPTFTDSSPVFDTSVFINMIQANGMIYFGSSLDRVIRFDGTDWKIYQELADPTALPTVVKTGAGTGTRSYYWRYANLNDSGTSLASPAVTVEASGTGWLGSMPTIDGTTYATVTLPSAPTGTQVRAIYRGDVSGKEFFLDFVTGSTNTYIDKNTSTPSTVFAVPKDNTTKGYYFHLLQVYRDSLVGTTVEEGKDILVWSAGTGLGFSLNDPREDAGTFDSFSLADGAGFDDYHKGDGQSINALQAFSVANSDGLAVFKDRRVGLLEFDADGNGNVQNVNVVRGTMSPHSPHVAGNNIRFYSDEGVASLGHEENYGTILRYSVMSLKAQSLTNRVTPANLPKVCSEYYKNLSLFGISTATASDGNNSILVYDERYNTWSHWTGLHPGFFFKGIHPTTKIENLYFGTAINSGVGGAIVEMFKGRTDYSTGTGSGNKITLSVTTKQYDGGIPDRFKKFDKVVLIFGTLIGSNTTVQSFYMGERGLGSFPRYRIPTEASLSGFGNDEWGNQEVGMMTVDDEGETLNIRYINLRQRDLFWSKINLQNDGIQDEVTLIGIAFYYSDSQRQLPGRSRLRTLA